MNTNSSSSRGLSLCSVGADWLSSSPRYSLVADEGVLEAAHLSRRISHHAPAAHGDAKAALIQPEHNWSCWLAEAARGLRSGAMGLVREVAAWGPCWRASWLEPLVNE